MIVEALLGMSLLQLYQAVAPNLTSEALSRLYNSTRKRLHKEHNFDLEKAVSAAFAGATLKLSTASADEDGRLLFAQLHKHVKALFPLNSDDFPNAVTKSLLVGDKAQLQTALLAVVEGYFAGRTPQLRALVASELPPLFLHEFYTVIKTEEHEKGWKAYERQILLGTRQELEQQAEKLDASQQAVLEKLDAYIGGSLPVPDISVQLRQLADDWRQALQEELQKVLDSLRLLHDAQRETHSEIRDTHDVAKEILQEVRQPRGTSNAPVEPPAYKLPPPNDYCVGREAMITALHNVLQSDNTALWRQALNGIGGIGKTTLANAYCHVHRNDYPHLFWVTADTDATLESAFITIANLLNLPVQDAQNDRQRFEAAREWFGNRKNYLLVLDNLERGELLANVFAAHGVGGRLLLTTRLDANDVPLCNAFQEVPALSREKAVHFLFEKSGRDRSNAGEYAAAQELADLLHCQPLKLKAAAAYLQLNKAVSIRAHAAKKQDEVWNESLALAARYGQTPTYIGIIGLLNTSVFLAPDDIPDAFASAYCLNKAALTHDCLNLLSKLALIDWNRDAHTYAIHRQLRELLTAKLPQQTQHGYAQRACEIMETLYPAPNSETWQDSERLLPHVLVCADNVRRYDLKSILAGKLLYRACLYLNQRARYNTAYTVEAVLKEKQKELGISELDMQQLAGQALNVEGLTAARKLNDQAIAYYKQGRYAEAEPLLVQALDIRREALPEGHSDIARSLNNLAELYRAQSRYAEAEPLYKQALNIVRQALGEQHPHVATSLNNLALSYESQGRYAKAEPLYLQALDIRRHNLGKDHPDIAQSLNNLAGLYVSQGHYAEAEPLFKQALDIHRQAYGEQHSHVATSLNNLAGLYKSQGRYAEAEPLYLQALAILEDALGAQHPHTLTCRENLKTLREEREQSANEA